MVPLSGPGREPTVVIGIGNEFRRDDGAGPAVIGKLRGRVPAAVAAADLTQGPGLTPAVAAAVDTAALAILDHLAASRS